MKQYLTITTKEAGKTGSWKAGNGPVIILIHGLTDTSAVWQNLIPQLAADFTVLAPDLPGVGGSEFEGAELTIEMMAESVNTIMDHEGVESAVIVGHSMGGYTALAFAEKYPDKVKGLALVHSHAFADTEERKEIRRKSVELIKKGGKEPLLRQMVPGLYAENFRNQKPEELNELTTASLKLNGDSLVRFYEAMIKRPDRTNVLRSATFPVLWIVGKEDALISLDTVARQCYLADVNYLKVYQDCGHMAMIEQPERLLNDLHQFCLHCYETVN